MSCKVALLAVAIFLSSGVARGSTCEYISTLMTMQRGPILVGNKDWNNWDLLQPKLREALLRWEQLGRPGNGVVPFASPADKTAIRVGDTSYEIVEILGEGAEGTVYKVKDRDGFKVVKQFWRGSRYMLESLKLLLTSFVAFPRVYAFDVDYETVVSEYVEGIPANVLLEHGALLGLSRDELQEISERFNERQGAFVRDFGLGYIGTKAKNWLLNVVNGGFYLIDPI